MLGFLTVVVMFVVAYSFWREGIFTAFTMMVNVFVSGLVAFNFWEPLAGQLESMFAGTFLEGYEDAICLTALFAASLGLLRWATNTLVNAQIDYHPLVQQLGAGFFGLITGYLLAGFLICLLQTLPWHENFMSFEVKMEPDAPNAKIRRVLPPDRVWLALMQRASEVPFSQVEGKPFDKDGTFELRYARYRRYNDTREPLPYQGELPP